MVRDDASFVHYGGLEGRVGPVVSPVFEEVLADLAVFRVYDADSSYECPCGFLLPP